MNAMSDQYSLEDQESSVRLRQAWDNVQARLRTEVTGAVFERFLKPLRPLRFEEDAAIFVAPGTFVHEWVKEKYLGKLQAAIEDEVGTPVRIDLRLEAREKPSDEMGGLTVGPAVVADPPSRFRPVEKYRFDTFIVGASNRLAFAGAKAVASRKGGGPTALDPRPEGGADAPL